MQWSDEEKNKMFSLLEAGKTTSEVGEILGRSKNSVISAYNRNKASDHKPLRSADDTWTSEDHEKAKELWAAGARREMIAKTLNRTIDSVSGRTRTFRECFPKRTSSARDGIAFLNKRIAGSLHLEKPTPENTIIEYEYEEIPVPENAPLVSYLELKPHKCKWICDEFWDEFDIETSKCCGLDVENKHGSAMQRNYCNRHYKASVRIKD